MRIFPCHCLKGSEFIQSNSYAVRCTRVPQPSWLISPFKRSYHEKIPEKSGKSELLELWEQPTNENRNTETFHRVRATKAPEDDTMSSPSRSLLRNTRTCVEPSIFPRCYNPHISTARAPADVRYHRLHLSSPALPNPADHPLLAPARTARHFSAARPGLRPALLERGLPRCETLPLLLAFMPRRTPSSHPPRHGPLHPGRSTPAGAVNVL